MNDFDDDDEFSFGDAREIPHQSRKVNLEPIRPQPVSKRLKPSQAQRKLETQQKSGDPTRTIEVELATTNPSLSTDSAGSISNAPQHVGGVQVPDVLSKHELQPTTILTEYANAPIDSPGATTPLMATSDTEERAEAEAMWDEVTAARQEEWQRQDERDASQATVGLREKDEFSPIFFNDARRLLAEHGMEHHANEIEAFDFRDIGCLRRFFYRLCGAPSLPRGNQHSQQQIDGEIAKSDTSDAKPTPKNDDASAHSDTDKDESSSDKLVVNVRNTSQVYVRGDLEWERDAVFAMALTPLDHSLEMHRRIMRTLYKELNGGGAPCPMIGMHWESIGFQGSDPATDLRGAGMFGVLQLLAVAKREPELAQKVYALSRDDHQQFPLAVASLNLSGIVLQVLRQAGYLYTLARRHRNVFDAVDELYIALMHELYLIWKNECKTVMQFDPVKTRLEDAAFRHTERFMTRARQRLRAMSSFVEPPFGADADIGTAARHGGHGQSTDDASQSSSLPKKTARKVTLSSTCTVSTNEDGFKEYDMGVST